MAEVPNFHPNPMAREMSLAERLEDLANRIASAVVFLGTKAIALDDARRAMSVAESDLTSAQVALDALEAELRTLQADHGLLMSVPAKAR